MSIVVLAAVSAGAGMTPPATAFPPPGSRLVVVAPHPDDETLGAGGLIERVVATGGQVKVVLMTTGDGFPDGVTRHCKVEHPTPEHYRAYGRVRRDETRRALATLGIAPADAVFLGFPDGGLGALRGRHLARAGLAYESPFTEAREPPAADALIPGIRYTGEDLEAALALILRRFRPTLVATTDQRDQHPDHSATGFFVEAALERARRTDRALDPRLLTFVVHFGAWPPRGPADASAPLQPPPGFPARQWMVLPLTAHEVSHKRAALLQYGSQLLVMRSYLLAFARANELYLAGDGRPLPRQSVTLGP